MSSFSELFMMWRTLLTDIWNGIFGVELFDGLNAKILILGILLVSFSISIFRYFVSNTHAELGTYTDTVTATESLNYDTGKTSRTLTRARTSSKRHRSKIK